MTDKEILISNICSDMENFIEETQKDFLQVILQKNLKGYDVIPQVNYLSTETHDNLWILQRYTIDLLGAGRAESTIKQYVWTINKLFLYYSCHYTRITGQMCMDYIATEGYKHDWSQTYKSNIYRTFSAFWGWAYKKHHIEKDIKQDLNFIKAVPKKKDRLTVEEVENCRFVASQLPVEYSALLELMLTAGMRVGEIAALNIENLNFSTNEINIWGEKTQTWRIAYMSPAAKIAIKRYLGDRTSGPVFTNRANKPMADHTLELKAKEIGAKAECHLVTTVHVFRKTFASIIYTRTQDILLVSKLLGHSTTATTIKCYLVDDIEDMKHRMVKIFI